MRILLAVDGSRRSDQAVEEVAHRPWPEGSQLRVISVAESVQLGFVGLPAAYFGSLTDPVSAASHEAVSSAVRKLNSAFSGSVMVHGEILTGSPKHVIVEDADHWGADLIVLGSYGHGTLERLLTGSVSQSVVSHAHCSVEIVRGGEPERLFHRVRRFNTN